MLNKHVFNYSKRTMSFIKIYFKQDGVVKECKAEIGNTILKVGLDNNIPLDGACGGLQSCSTCHVYVDEKYLKKIPSAEEKEEDILDMVDDLEDNSRLSCAIKITPSLDGMTLNLPETVNSLIK